MVKDLHFARRTMFNATPGTADHIHGQMQLFLHYRFVIERKLGNQQAMTITAITTITAVQSK